MHILSCQVGLWKACATVENIAHDTLMAIIQVSDRDDTEKINSRHTVVFNRLDGADIVAETQAMMHRLLNPRYGA